MNIEISFYQCDETIAKSVAPLLLKVLDENKLNPSTTLFIDDSPQHIKGARKAGIHAFHLKDGIDVCDLFGFS
jgi:putative hydrolase of the HAD superfamily